MVHADPSDGENYPRVHFFYVVMNTLLIGTLILGCLHALLWLIRALAAGEHKIPKPAASTTRWFDVAIHRQRHPIGIRVARTEEAQKRFWQSCASVSSAQFTRERRATDRRGSRCP